MSRLRLLAILGISALAMYAGVGNSRGSVDAMIDGAKGDVSLIGVVRLDPQASYVGAPELLESYIKDGDKAAWHEIKEKINYTYAGLGHALWPVLEKDGLRASILQEIRSGKKLFFKPNLVVPRTLDLAGDGTPGSRSGVFSCTSWTFMAALMRFFHDELGIRYYQMALGEAGTLMPTYASSLNCPPEAIVEGCGFELPDGRIFNAGWCMRWIRRYLAEETRPWDSKDDPQNGYSDSIKGRYLTPGQATTEGKLMVYDLNRAEWFDRGRRVHVPDGGDNYKHGIVIHKAVVGDPDDPDNYPGAVLVNTPILKVHSLTIITNAIKNIGIGMWPMTAGHDSDLKTADWLYSYPPDTPPGLKGGVPGWSGGPPWRGGGVYHDKWYVLEADDEGMPLKITKNPNMGLDGSMVDINLAVKGQVPCVLHVVDAVNVIDIEHGGRGNGTPRQEGLILASTDPVALDLLCARYMFTNVPMDPRKPDQFVRTVPVPKYDESSNAIVTEMAIDSRLSRSKLFDYAAKRGLGKVHYYVSGADLTSSPASSLASQNGHFGRVQGDKFVEILTDQLYFHQLNAFWDLQKSFLGYAEATDRVSGSDYYKKLMSLDEDQNGIVDDCEFGTNGMWDCAIAVTSIGCNYIGKGQLGRGIFFMNSRLLKYSDPLWNIGKVDSTRVLMDGLVFPVAFRMATDRNKEGTDSFFGLPYGAVDGVPKWPSFQFAKYALEVSTIYDRMYANAAAFSKKSGKDFRLYVPNRVPYAPSGTDKQPSWTYNPKKLANVVELDPMDPDYSKLVFTVEFTEPW